MTAKQQPTNAILLKEIKEVQATLLDHNTRLNGLEYKNMMVEAHEAALKQVRQEERESIQAETGKAWLKVIKELYPILAVLGLIIYAYAHSHGIATP